MGLHQLVELNRIIFEQTYREPQFLSSIKFGLELWEKPTKYWRSEGNVIWGPYQLVNLERIFLQPVFNINLCAKSKSLDWIIWTLSWFHQKDRQTDFIDRLIILFRLVPRAVANGMTNLRCSSKMVRTISFTVHKMKITLLIEREKIIQVIANFPNPNLFSNAKMTPWYISIEYFQFIDAYSTFLNFSSPEGRNST